jgi:DNA-binding response OmpR family regulator
MHGSFPPIGRQPPAVLVIHEDETTRRRIVDALRRRDYRAIEAANGATGLRLLEESTSMSVVVVDLVLPRMSGWDFRRRQLRTRFASVPTIVVSAQPLCPTDLEMLRPAQVIEKPLDVESLLAMIGRLSTPTAPHPTLFWSKRGEVACSNHAPAADSSQWTDYGWCRIPASGSRKVVYQCQRCAADRSPVARRSRPRPATSFR